MHVRGLHPKFCAIRAFSTSSKCPYRGANFPMHALHPTLCAIREFSTSSKCPYRGETIPMHVRGLPPTLHAICAFSKSPQTQTPIEATRVACTYPGCTKSFNQNGTCKPVERARSFAGLNEKPAHSLTPWARACPRFRRCGFSVKTRRYPREQARFHRGFGHPWPCRGKPDVLRNTCLRPVWFRFVMLAASTTNASIGVSSSH